MFDRWAPPQPPWPGRDPGPRGWLQSRSAYHRSSFTPGHGKGSELSGLDTTAPRGGWIAISGLKRRNEEDGRIPIYYARSVVTAGGRPVVLSTFELRPGQRPPAGAEVIAGLDPGDRSVLEGAVGLILTGGGDVQPSLYGQRPHPRTYNVSPRRDAFELMLLEEALERDMPVLAICRGMQLLNVALGGTLEQHLSDVGGRLEHDRDRPRAEVAHDVRVEEGSIAADIFGSLRVGVNSHHHQGLGKVPEVLEEIAWADDGVLEAAVSRVHPWVLAVQWHPEVMADTDERQMDLFRAFVAATSTYREAEGAAAAKSA